MAETEDVIETSLGSRYQQKQGHQENPHGDPENDQVDPSDLPVRTRRGTGTWRRTTGDPRSWFGGWGYGPRFVLRHREPPGSEWGGPWDRLPGAGTPPPV